MLVSRVVHCKQINYKLIKILMTIDASYFRRTKYCMG